jgi:hypothetical protein
MKTNKFFMPNRQIFRGGPEFGGDVEKSEPKQPTFNETKGVDPDPKESHEKVVDEARKKLVELKQEPVLHEPTPEEIEIRDRFLKCEVRKQTVESYLNTIRLTETGKGPKFEADKKLVESLKGKILTICDEIEKDATEIHDILAKRDVDKEAAQRYIDYAKNTRDSLK